MTEASYEHQNFPGNMNHADHVTVIPLLCHAATQHISYGIKGINVFVIRAQCVNLVKVIMSGVLVGFAVLVFLRMRSLTTSVRTRCGGIRPLNA